MILKGFSNLNDSVMKVGIVAVVATHIFRPRVRRVIILLENILAE